MTRFATRSCTQAALWWRQSPNHPNRQLASPWRWEATHELLNTSHGVNAVRHNEGRAMPWPLYSMASWGPRELDQIQASHSSHSSVASHWNEAYIV